ncbi:MAG: MBL fold metallo-hydrolase [Alphaproteobacteria bacterium]|nr:MBL fold metallo-hydrolase [Alphaproteobacteria bacterium]
MKPEVTSFFDEATYTITHVVADPKTRRAAIIDPVLDYDPKSGRTATRSADRVIAHVREAGLTIDWILETHAHADHLSAGPYLKSALGGKTGIGAHITDVQEVFGTLFNAEPDFARDGSQFDQLFEDGARFAIGGLEARVMHTPGHTPACVTYVVGDAAFVGDTLFMPDYGTARCDFPRGDAATLYRSIRRIFSLPDETRLFLCHDYKAPGRDSYVWETTVGAEKAGNVHVHEGVSEAEFVAMRTARDRTLGMPVLLLPAVQVNMRAGAFPPPEDNGIRYLKIPLDAV